MIKGIVFDKDGTLFDFNATWGAWARIMLAREAAGDVQVLHRLATLLGYDIENERFLPGSIVIAETVEVVADAILTVIDDDRTALKNRMNAAASEVAQVEATPLIPLFANLRRRGLMLGVATNDAIAPATAHLDRAGVLDTLDFLAGYDSGHGGKPAPGQLLAFCAETGLSPADCAMVGDSLHDLQAGRAAGMTTIGVLTGPAPREELSPLADVVLTSIADLPDWLSAR